MANILIGIISGLVSGMGMGGGTILILCLSLFMGIDQHTAQGANLVFFVPTSIVSIITNIKQKLIKWKTALIVSRMWSSRSCNRCKNFNRIRYKSFENLFWNIFINYCWSRNFYAF